MLTPKSAASDEVRSADGGGVEAERAEEAAGDVGEEEGHEKLELPGAAAVVLEQYHAKLDADVHRGASHGSSF